MKKINYIVFLIIALFITTVSVDAATITKTSYDGNVKIEGTGTGQIQIVLFDLDNKPIYMTTANSTGDTFSITLPKIEGLSEGTYTVKAADYTGENVDAEEVKVVPVSNTTTENPKTSDNILTYSIVGGICLIGVVAGVFLLKRKNQTKTSK